MNASPDLDLAVAAPPSKSKQKPSKHESGESRRPEFDWNKIRSSPGFVPGVALAIGVLAAFWSLLSSLPAIWFADDGYYSHGILVPFISLYVVYRWWPNLSKIPVKPAVYSLVLLVPLLYFIVRPAEVNRVDQLTSVCLILCVLLSVAFIAGWRWMFALSLPTLYLAFALPIWNMAITYYTNPLQLLSTKVAYHMLEWVGKEPFSRGDNFIYLGSGFQLDVGVPCSGLKLVLALYAFTFFFAMIARLRWWANVILIGVIPLPLALFINGLRIALIGIVGDTWGNDAGHTFHDWSGYITLIVCFFILFRIARWLGWKD